jgi:hypothetical protein
MVGAWPPTKLFSSDLVLITIGMCFWLYGHYKKSEFKTTRAILLHYLSLALSTNAVTGILSIATAALYGVNKAWYGATITYLLGSLYHITITVALLARSHFKTGNTTAGTGASNSSSMLKNSFSTYNISAQRASHVQSSSEHELHAFASLRHPTPVTPSFHLKDKDLEKAESISDQEAQSFASSLRHPTPVTPPTPTFDLQGSGKAEVLTELR